jgi:hypothetical protein
MSDIRHAIGAILFCALVGDSFATEKIKINVRQPDAAIRQQLLTLTPLGTSIEKVHNFLENRLERDKGTHIAGWPVRLPGASMIVALGHYYELRTVWEAFFPFPTVVDATWLFDEQNKLRDIHVRRLVHGL